MATTIKNIQKPKIDLTEVPEDTSSSVDIFIWEKKYKEANRKDTKIEEKKDVQPTTPALHPTT